MPEQVDEISIPVSDLSTFSIKIEGEQIPVDVQVRKLLVIKEVNKIPSVRLTITDGDPSTRDFKVSDGDKFIPGKNIEIMMGYHNDDISIFKGIITQHSNTISERRSELVVECKDKAVKMTIARKNKHYNDVTDSDIAETIIGSYGLQSEIESSSITHKDLVQYEISDWDFLLSRMDMIGKICVVSDGKLTIKKPDLNAEPLFSVSFGTSVLNYSASIDARNQLKALTAKSWSFSDQAIMEATAEEPSITTEPGNITNSDISDVLGIQDFALLHSGKLAQEELQAWADAKLMKHRLSKVTGSVKFQGYPQLQPATFINLNAVGSRFGGPVFVNSVKHEYTNGNWQTEAVFGMSAEWYSQQKDPFSAVAAYGRMSREHGLVVGIVTDLEDPLGEGRIKIRIPVINTSDEGVWARLATLDAGKERGTFFLPELDDEMIVGFVQGDVSHPVILGMLHSSAKPAPLTAANANDEKGYVSREKMKMIFNDKEKSLKIETPAGKKVTISEQDALIRIEDENGNKITMDQAGITVEAAATLTLKGGSALKIEAPSVSLNGSGTTEIKGGMVKIN